MFLRPFFALQEYQVFTFETFFFFKRKESILLMRFME